MVKIICDRCGAEIPREEDTWYFYWRIERKNEGFKHRLLKLCQKCKEEAASFVDADKTEMQEKPKRSGRPRKDSGQRLDHKKIRSLKDQGLGRKEIARRLGYTYNQVNNSLNYHKGLKDGGDGEEGIDKGKVRALFFAGWKIPKIAEEMRRSEEEIREVIASM